MSSNFNFIEIASPFIHLSLISTLEHKSQHKIILHNDIRARVTDLIMFWENLTGVDASSKHVYVDQDIGSTVVQMDKCFHISMQGYNQYSISVVIEYQFS